MSRVDTWLDRSRVSPLLLSLGLILLPQAWHARPWILLLVLGLGIWRWLAASRGWHLPGPVPRALAAIGGLVLILISYRSINGIDAGSALLVLMLGFKLTELRQRRDVHLLVLLGYFLIGAELLHGQSIPVVLYLLPVTVIHTAVFLWLMHGGELLGARTALREAGRMLALALPLMLLLFLLFPRLPGPLWGAGKTSSEAVTGLDDRMTPGAISRLAQSDAVAFRVNFDGPPPPPDKRYWRGLVLHDFDGRTWSPGNRPTPASPAVTTQSAPLYYTVMLEPTDQHWLFTLDMPVQLPDGKIFTPDHELLSRKRVTQTERYRAGSVLDYRIGRSLTAYRRVLDLSLPSGTNPRARSLAQRWSSQSARPEQTVQTALAYFHNRPFRYTLRPPRLGDNPVDGFLFDTQAGFCEHYAGAFVFLMRAAGIPAHVVIGYQGGKMNPLGDYMIVRQSAAHAWAEVWLENRGWVRVDPTAAVAPERVERGFDAALPDAASWFSRYSLTNNLELTWDMVNARWDEWILGYGPDSQVALLNWAGIERRYWEWLGALLGGSLVLFSIALWLVLQRRARPPEALRLWNTVSRRLARFGLRRDPSEGPRSYARRVEKARPDLAVEIRRITELYIEARYAAQPRQNIRAALRRAVAAFKPRRR